LYATDAPAALEIPVVQVQGLHVAGKTILRLEWKDPSGDAATLAEAKTVWQSEDNAVHSEATDRFFDACAVMLPAQPVTDGAFPSLQMGDPGHPVLIYYYSAARGAAVMDASGRGTTRRTDETFPVHATYVAGAWQVTMELPEIPAETPLSVAVWNGSQQDRDGRKYFSVWHKIR
jgi:DMSO reductase family type II enzyme heme b subunit